MSRRAKSPRYISNAEDFFYLSCYMVENQAKIVADCESLGFKNLMLPVELNDRAEIYRKNILRLLKDIHFSKLPSFSKTFSKSTNVTCRYFGFHNNHHHLLLKIDYRGHFVIKTKLISSFMYVLVLFNEICYVKDNSMNCLEHKILGSEWIFIPKNRRLKFYNQDVQEAYLMLVFGGSFS